MGKTKPPKRIESELICFTEKFNGFTFGKLYKGKVQYNIFTTNNDSGNRQAPCVQGKRLGSNPTTIKYFLTLQEWREYRLSNIL